MSEQISNEQRLFALEATAGNSRTSGAPSVANQFAMPGDPAEPFDAPLNLVPPADHVAAIESVGYMPYGPGVAAPAPAGNAPGADLPTSVPMLPSAPMPPTATGFNGVAAPAHLTDLADLSEGSLPIVKPLDSKHSPALRIARSRPQRPRLSQGPRPTRKTAPLALRPENPPPLLRLRRLLVGIVLLALAWAGVLAVVFITLALINGFPTQPHLSIRLALYILGAAGTLWLAVMTLASIVVGAFSLTLALTTGGW